MPLERAFSSVIPLVAVIDLAEAEASNYINFIVCQYNIIPTGMTAWSGGRGTSPPPGLRAV